MCGNFSDLFQIRKCDEKNFGVSPLCNLDLRANLPKPQIWGSAVLDQMQNDSAEFLKDVMSSKRVLTSGVSLLGKNIFTKVL
jgi:hypothetical protein